MTALTYTATRKIHADHTASELVNNGQFPSNITGWTDASTGTGSIAWNAGGYLDLISVDSSNRAFAKQTLTGLIVGVEYTFSLDTLDANYMAVWLGDADESSSYYSVASVAIETLSTTFTATTTSCYIKLWGATIAVTSGVDNVSCQLSGQFDKDLTALSNLSENWPIKSDEQVAIDGSTETILHRQDQVWSASENLITYAELTSDYWYEFLASVYGGETFTFDANGTIAAPDNPVDVILVKGSQNIARNSTNDLFTVSFSVREI